MKELKDIILSAKNGDEKAMEVIIETFEPLIKKYERIMNYDEDFRSDLILFLIETIYKIDLLKFRLLTDYSIINYVRTSFYRFYIIKSQKMTNIRSHEIQSEIEDIDEWGLVDYDSYLPTENVLLDIIMKEKLSAREYVCVKLMVIDGLSSSEVSKKLGITRQTVNEAKNRGLKKLKGIFK